jgi:hypothetical protein
MWRAKYLPAASTGRVPYAVIGDRVERALAGAVWDAKADV